MATRHEHSVNLITGPLTRRTLPFTEMAVSTAQRQKCLACFLDRAHHMQRSAAEVDTVSLTQFLSEVERSLWEKDARLLQYTTIATQVMDAMAMNFNYIRRCNPSAIVHMDMFALCKGTDLERTENAADRRGERVEAALREKTVIARSNAKSSICTMCGAMGVSVNTKQTRSADEGETPFFTCYECNQTRRED
jgi:DNA-directed RNA polymerase subunit M/transcription elongation factor TFIIS